MSPVFSLSGSGCLGCSAKLKRWHSETSVALEACSGLQQVMLVRIGLESWWVDGRGEVGGCTHETEAAGARGRCVLHRTYQATTPGHSRRSIRAQGKAARARARTQSCPLSQRKRAALAFPHPHHPHRPHHPHHHHHMPCVHRVFKKHTENIVCCGCRLTIIASLWPTHMRVPMPKGAHTCGLLPPAVGHRLLLPPPPALPSGRKRSGLNASGSGQMSGSCITACVAMQSVEPLCGAGGGRAGWGYMHDEIRRSWVGWAEASVVGTSARSCACKYMR